MEWIKVTDRLPKKNTFVVVYKLDCVLHCLGLAFYNECGFLFNATTISGYEEVFEVASDLPILNITHWAYIEPPKNIIYDSI